MKANKKPISVFPDVLAILSVHLFSCGHDYVLKHYNDTLLCRITNWPYSVFIKRITFLHVYYSCCTFRKYIVKVFSGVNRNHFLFICFHKYIKNTFFYCKSRPSILKLVNICAPQIFSISNARISSTHLDYIYVVSPPQMKFNTKTPAVSFVGAVF